MSIGNTAFRVLIPLSSIAHVKDFPTSNGWWHVLNGHLYFAQVDDESDPEPRLCEITIRSYNERVTPDRTATWAVPVTNEHVLMRTGVRVYLPVA
jgi:salicylate hydroxylase